MKIKRKVVLAFIFLILMSSVAMAGVVNYKGSSKHEDSDSVKVSKKKSGDCEYERSDDGRKKEECDD
ncbi:MAG: hypothetical protein WC911_04105 [Thermoleophilia bacterium]